MLSLNYIDPGTRRYRSSVFKPYIDPLTAAVPSLDKEQSTNIYIHTSSSNSVIFVNSFEKVKKDYEEIRRQESVGSTDQINFLNIFMHTPGSE